MGSIVWERGVTHKVLKTSGMKQKRVISQLRSIERGGVNECGMKLGHSERVRFQECGLTLRSAERGEG